MNTERRWVDPVGRTTTVAPPRVGSAAPADAPVLVAAPDGAVRSEARLHAGSVAGLRSLRTGLGHCLEQAECHPDTIADAQLVLAEIATNAFVHDMAPLVQIQVVCTDDEITIATAHRGEIAPPSFPVSSAPVSGPFVTPGGRGLAIVDRIVTTREVGSHGGCTTTTVRLRR